MQSARISRNEAYFPYAAMTKDEVQHSRMAFYEAVIIGELHLSAREYDY
ncbi:MAG: hypothetical protein ABIJ52_15150 [Pseudomonadota bacterium]|nr:hypothetical protein [Pseudomonadota bacterium]